MNIVLVAGHYTDLYICDKFYQLICNYKNDKIKISFYLILIKNPMLDSYSFNNLSVKYLKIFELPYIDSCMTTNWLFEFNPLLIISNLRKLFELNNVLKKIDFNKEKSIFVFNEFSDTSLTSRLIIKKFRHSIKYRLSSCYRRVKKFQNNSLLAFINTNLFLFLKLDLLNVRILKPLVAERHYIYEKKIFTANLIYSNKFDFNNYKIFFQFPINPKKNNKKKKIIFFDKGIGILNFFPELNKQIFISKINKILNCLTIIYPNKKYDLYIKAHPRQDKNYLNTTKFKLIDKNILAENYLEEEKNSIDSVFSISSTVNRTSDILGIQSFVLYPLFDFPKHHNTILHNFLIENTNVKAITSFNDLFKLNEINEAYKNHVNDNEKWKLFSKMILDEKII